MIRRVRLSNWKRHEALECGFSPGLNFVLGANGHGKTSLLEGIRFGLLGPESGVDAEESLRFDKEHASVEVELEGNPTVVVGHTVDQRGRVTPISSSRSATSARDLVARNFGAEALFLRYLLFLGEGEIFEDRDAGQGLDQQLEALLPISGFSTLLGEISDERRLLARDQRSQRTGLKTSREELAQLAQKQERVRQEVEQAKARERPAEERRLQLADHMRRHERWRRQQGETRAWEEQAAEFATSMGLPASADAPLDHELSELEGRRSQAEERARALTEQRGALHARTDSLVSYINALNEADERRCPLCRQDLDEEHRQSVLAQYEAEHKQLVAEQERVAAAIDAATAEVEAARHAVEMAQRLIANRPHGSDASDVGPPDLPQLLERAEQELVEIRATRANLEQELATTHEHFALARADVQAEHRVVTAYRDDALLATVEEGLEGFQKQLRQSLLRPLAEQLGNQWKAYRPDAEWTLSIDEDGGLCLARDSQTRSYAALSGGEKTVATILLRLSLLCALTTSDVMVLDEPLEHLDARSRRLMVSSLHHAIRKGLLRQVVVSTYEEPLVRRLLDHSDVQAIWFD